MMDQNLIYAKTSSGEEAVRQSTRVVQRNLRLVLVQVDGKLNVAELGAKVGNAKLVESALRELEEGGFIAPVMGASSVWEQGRKVAKELKSVASQFSIAGNRGGSVDSTLSAEPLSLPQSGFSTFGKPILPVPETPAPIHEPPPLRGDSGKERKISSRRFRPVYVVWLLAALLGAAGAGCFLYPYNRFKPELEAALGQALRAPVRIGNVSFTALPRPALSLQRLEIGPGGAGRVAEIRIYSPWSLLASGRRAIPAVELAGATLPAESLGGLMSLSGEAGGFSVGSARLTSLSVGMGDLALANLEGEAAFREGKLEKVAVHTGDRTLRIEAFPSPSGLALNVVGQAWKPLEGLAHVFDSFQAKGLLQKDKLVLRDIDALSLGGAVRGSWLLDWSNGLTMVGEGAVDRLSARRLAEAFAAGLQIDGALSGSVRARAGGKDLSALWNSLEAVADVDIARGSITGVDLGEAARRGSGSPLRGGSTKFDHLRGVLRLTPQQVTGSDVRLEAGLLAAQGQFLATRERKVEGAFNVNISSAVMAVRAPVRMSGVLPEPVLTVSR